MNHYNKLTDEEIQHLMDRKNSSSEKPSLTYFDKDAELYEALMKSLDTEPSIYIPADFAAKTIQIASRRKAFRDMIWNAILILSVSVPIITLSLSVIYFMGENIFWELVTSFKSGSKYILFAAIGISLIQILDKVLIQNKLKEIQHS